MKLSIVYHLYNEYETLKESINSILTQSSKNYELILLYDCPTENVLKVLDEFDFPKNKKVTIYKFMENYGRSFTYNFALNLVKSEYVYFSESKAVLHKDFVKTIIEKAKEKKYDVMTFLLSYHKEHPDGDHEIINGDDIECIKDIVNTKSSVKNKVFRTKFLVDKKIDFVQYKSYNSLYLFNVYQNFKTSYFINKKLLIWKRNPLLGYQYNLYNILESAQILVTTLKQECDNEFKNDAYMTWVPIVVLYEFIKKIKNTYYDNEKIIAKSIENAYLLIDKLYPNFKQNKNLDYLFDKDILTYLKNFKPSLSYVKKYLK